MYMTHVNAMCRNGCRTVYPRSNLLGQYKELNSLALETDRIVQSCTSGIPYIIDIEDKNALEYAGHTS